MYFVLMLFVPINNFQSCRDDFLPSWVEPVLSRDKNFLLRHNTVTLSAASLELATVRSQSNALPTEPLHSAIIQCTDFGLH